MRLTTDHSASSYGMPIFVDNNNNALNYAEGIKKFRQQFNLSVKGLAKKCGVSARTVEGWEQGRLPSKSALLLMQLLLIN